jgi:hypothetical protein
MSESEKELEVEVSDETFELCVKVGMQLATDRDYFQICLNHASEQFKKENPEITTA